MARLRRLIAVAAGNAAGSSRARSTAARLILCWFASTATVVAQEPATEIATGPVAIRSFQLMTPYEMAGSGIDPEVEVRVQIDAAGRVAGVQALAIDPPSEFDDLLRSHVETRVGGWRYGPARDANDNSVPSTLSWRMKFESPDSRGNRVADERRRPDPELGVLVRLGGLPLAVRPLTGEQRGRALNRAVEAAEQYLDRDHRQRRETPRFIVISDAEDASHIDILAGNMEAVFEVFHRIFDPYLKPFAENFKTVVYLYSRQQNLERLQSELGGSGFGSGFYRSPGFLAFHQEVEDSDYLLHTMLHEAFHAFRDSHLTAPGKELPRWTEEGLAEYFGNSKIEKGRLVPGKVSHGKYVIFHANPVRRLRSRANWSLLEARSDLRNGDAPTVAELLEAGRDTFYGERHRQYYGFSWLLTHFLQHGRQEWETEKPFAGMLLYLAEGYSGRDAMAATFGFTPEEVQAEFERYVRRF